MAKVVNITTRLMDGKTEIRSIAVPMSLPTSTSEAVKMWGEEIVLNLATRAAIVDIQAKIRPMLAAGTKFGVKDTKRMADPAIVAEFRDFKPKMGRRVDPEKKINDMAKLAARMTQEEIQKAIAASRNGNIGLVKAPAKAAGNKPARR